MERKPELLPGERVLWTGTPVDRPFVTRRDTFLVLAAVVAFVLTVTLLRKEDTPADKLAGAAVLVIVVGAAVGALVLRRVRSATMTYTITNLRVVEAYGAFRSAERSEYLTALDVPVVVPGNNGAGTITFGETDRASLALGAFGVRSWRAHGALTLVPTMLIGIADPDDVHDLLIQAMGEARAP